MLERLVVLHMFTLRLTDFVYIYIMTLQNMISKQYFMYYRGYEDACGSIHCDDLRAIK